MYQIFMRPGTTEFALMVCFELGLYSKVVPLAHEDRLGNKDFPIPVSFFYGDKDWVRSVEMDAGKAVVEVSQHAESKYHLVTNSDHNMHMDNPLDFSNLIINDVIAGSNLPVGV